MTTNPFKILADMIFPASEKVDDEQKWNIIHLQSLCEVCTKPLNINDETRCRTCAGQEYEDGSRWDINKINAVKDAKKCTYCQGILYEVVCELNNEDDPADGISFFDKCPRCGYVDYS